ncbi:5-oxoprolinase subunit C family protein [Pedobacter frigoris]|uniref:Biotin-dependent carboxyltransferase family protein n=1 Tax=Pedobacter frigoris TaxID=2571272 RepID=A0A4U1CDJ0_9SPHI|nr:biotin-dependent carboxyltransferase family protein [Pedobacter frigoris]TKC04274.1 biotin-dependent carboxyltransferase family protein [Pedobacter frigoris]
MGIRILKPGLLSTVQDTGRYGHQKSGMVVSGAMDTLALKIGNMLLGNALAEAALECTLSGPELIFERDQLIAITGGNLSPQIDGVPLTMWKPVYVREGAKLSFGKATSGCRTYLSVYRGFDVPEVLGSKSTYLRGGMGGWEGRALKKDDFIPFNAIYQGQHKFDWSAGKYLYPDLSNHKVRVIEGPEFGHFTAESIAAFFSQPFAISNEADRMGYRLTGQTLQRHETKEMLSAAVTFGTIQVPAQGVPIVLMADHQTTGGYPRIAQVISADLTLLAQMQPGREITFELITLEEAQALLLAQEQQMNQLRQTITLKYG